ncbi:MAG: hypothetical protein HC844_11520 [Tabrizicola sp.]|nr:hypothetical protein [Tabrizicola sp.]
MPTLSANDLLTQLIIQAGNRKDAWINRPLDVVRTSYEDAAEDYQKTMDDQKATDDFQAEVVIMLLIVGAGALATTLPTAAVLFGTAGTSAIGRFGGRIANLFPTARSAAVTFSNATITKYIWKTLSKESSSMLKKKATDGLKSQLTGGLASPSVVGGSPRSMFSAVKGQIDRVYGHLIDGMECVRDSDAPEQQKLTFVREIRSSPFLAAVPELESFRRTLQRRFTLMMFMNLILDLDFHGKARLVSVPTSVIPMRVVDYSPISTRPLDPAYPQKGPFSYNDTGNTVARRINALYKEEHGTRAGNFMPVNAIMSNVDATVLRKADQEARRLSSFVDLNSLIPIAKVL